MKSISINIKDESAERIDHLAESMDRSRSWIVNEAIEQYLEHQAWMDQQTAQAIADIDAGTAEMLSHEEVVKRAAERRKARHK